MLVPATNLIDLSGIAWVRENLFLGVHDTKSDEKLPRISLLQSPTGAAGILWKPLEVSFPEQESNDFESIARIPGSDHYLLCESCEQVAKKPYSNRIFLADFQGDTLQIKETAHWPITTKNIEGAAVGRLGADLILIFAERADGKKSTSLQVADLRSHPLRLENLRQAGEIVSPYPTGPNARPVSALAVDSSGNVYAASAEDPDDDNGPFSSAVYRVGAIASSPAGLTVRLFETPVQIAVLDGMKVEGLAIRELPGKPVELFVGLDDENYGGTLRPISIRR